VIQAVVFVTVADDTDRYVTNAEMKIEQDGERVGYDS
jgi:hypothetical protein